MKNRAMLMLLVLAATLTVVVGALSLHPNRSTTQPQATCYWVVSFIPYPHEIYWCPGAGGGGGGSW